MVLIDITKPKSCEECKKMFLDKGILIMCGIFYKDCPLKSIDELKDYIQRNASTHDLGENIVKNSIVSMIEEFAESKKD